MDTVDASVSLPPLPSHSEFQPLSIQEQSYMDDFRSEIADFSELRIKFNFLYHHLVQLHSHVSILTEAELMKFQYAAIRIQKVWRGYQVRKQYPQWNKKKNLATSMGLPFSSIEQFSTLSNEIQALKSMMHTWLTWQHRCEGFLQLSACKTLQHHWRQRKLKASRPLSSMSNQAIDEQFLSQLGKSHSTSSEISLDDFNYLKAEVDYLRTTIENMQLHSYADAVQSMSDRAMNESKNTHQDDSD